MHGSVRARRTRNRPRSARYPVSIHPPPGGSGKLGICPVRTPPIILILGGHQPITGPRVTHHERTSPPADMCTYGMRIRTGVPLLHRLKRLRNIGTPSWPAPGRWLGDSRLAGGSRPASPVVWQGPGWLRRPAGLAATESTSRGRKPSRLSTDGAPGPVAWPAGRVVCLAHQNQAGDGGRRCCGGEQPGPRASLRRMARIRCFARETAVSSGAHENPSAANSTGPGCFRGHNPVRVRWTMRVLGGWLLGVCGQNRTRTRADDGPLSPPSRGHPPVCTPFRESCCLCGDSRCP
jgi:hypothetical protein